MGNAASGLPFVVGEEVESYPESPETCSWRMHRGTKRVRLLPAFCAFCAAVIPTERDNHVLSKKKAYGHIHT